MMCCLKTELYKEQQTKIWPKTGRHILAQFDDQNIVVYQAFCPEIADYVVEHGRFGGPKYNLTRMTWVKTNFMWMMYRSGWGEKPNQERTLAIYLSREGFEEILNSTREGGTSRNKYSADDVRLQWDPDHSPVGDKLERRAIQLGLRGEVLKKFHSDWIQKVEDITDFVTEQRQHVINDKLDQLLCPSEREYVPESKGLCRHIRLAGFDEDDEFRKNKQALMEEKLDALEVEGACCSELLNEAYQQITEAKLNCKPDDKEKKEDVILCLGGAFNPVHTRHIEAVKVAIKWAEENTSYRVISANLAVAPAGYVRTKCRRASQPCMKAEHRIELCKLACNDEQLIKTYPKPVGSAKECGERVRKERGKPEAKIAIIVGADRAVTKSGNAQWIRKKNGNIVTVCVGRKGTTEEVKKAYIDDLRNDRVTNKEFYIAEQELDNVSSTDVRNALSEMQKLDDISAREEYMKTIVSKGWIIEPCGKYILDNMDDLYNV